MHSEEMSKILFREAGDLARNRAEKSTSNFVHAVDVLIRVLAAIIVGFFSSGFVANLTLSALNSS